MRVCSHPCSSENRAERRIRVKLRSSATARTGRGEAEESMGAFGGADERGECVGAGVAVGHAMTGGGGGGWWLLSDQSAPSGTSKYRSFGSLFTSCTWLQTR